MNKTISIKLKALFLLMVFALNTIVGFACATGVDMGFNHKHHHEETVGSHHHDEKDDADKDGGCCNGPVIKLQQLDKNINQTAKINIDAPLLLSLHALLGNDIFNTTPLISKYIVPLYYPPPPDIRIAIQSFLI